MAGPLVVVGGFYDEECLHPKWQEYYGSGGRAASAIAAMGTPVRFHTRVDPTGKEVLEARAGFEGFDIDITDMSVPISFQYHHPLESPRIVGVGREPLPPIKVQAESVIQFGMLEGDAIVTADRVVYDPQNAEFPQHFGENGSQARELALVLNRREARQLSRLSVSATAEDMALQLQKDTGAAVIVIKEGPQGAFVLEGQSRERVPAYRSQKVWKIGSGDTFVAHFGFRWLVERKTAVESVKLAALATAYYCQTRGFPTPKNFTGAEHPQVLVKDSVVQGQQPRVYLAGPFFTLSQLWLVKQARADLRSLGLNVFSPIHDVGRGPPEDVVQADLDGIKDADVLFAIADGLDSGTIYEIGYARALDPPKPVIVYSENVTGDDLTMMKGSGCILHSDYATAIYDTVWEAVKK